ncbi:MAG: efflux RND transporter periplasmic adaptor subunit, partial [Gemmatimonadota bacterium]|nr:efflux RND transporter periplasmic adaptor subunit [Gemmatimonadota bacterium]
MTIITKRLLAAALLLAGLGACGPGTSSEEGMEEGEERVAGVDRVELGAEAMADLSLTFATAEIQELVPSLEVPAEIAADPDRLAIVGSRVSGRIVAVMHNVGEEVSAGAPLVVLESVDIGAAVADFKSANANAEAARSAAARATRLFEDRIVSQRRVEETHAAHEAATAAAEAAATR